MKNVFIRLNLHNADDEIIYFNINHIVTLYPLYNCTSVETSGSAYKVKETQEEIKEMINKAQKFWI